MNERIEVLYDREHTLGHAFFIPVIDKLRNDGNEVAFAELGSVFKNKIIPLLQEYFSEDWNKIRLVLGDNQKETAKLGELVFVGEKRCEYQTIFGNNHGLDSYEQEKVIYQLAPFTTKTEVTLVWDKAEAYQAIYDLNAVTNKVPSIATETIKDSRLAGQADGAEEKTPEQA
jgi:5-methylcytosine-specific restriction protein B